MTYKHYIRINEKKQVVGGFSEAQELPKESDIFLRESPIASFQLSDEGELNPNVVNAAGVPLYLYENGKIVQRPQEDVDADTASRPTPGPTMEQKLVRMLAANGVLSEDQMEDVASGMREWKPGTRESPEIYSAQEVVRYEGVPYRCNKPGHAHHGEPGWEPPSVPALWTRIGKPGEEYQAWELPGGHNAPNKGDLRTHKGALWESLINGNATEPGSDDRWWKWIKDL